MVIGLVHRVHQQNFGGVSRIGLVMILQSLDTSEATIAAKLNGRRRGVKDEEPREPSFAKIPGERIWGFPKMGVALDHPFW